MSLEVLGGNYALRRVLGSGAVATVYLAHDITLERSVAIKRVSPENASPQHEQRLRREAHAMAALSGCRQVPQIHALGDADGRMYLVLEYIDGSTVKEYISRHHPVAIDAAVSIITQVATALAAAHAQDLIHRDIKPANLMIAVDGTLKVLDFGVVAVSDPEAVRLTETGHTPGTTAYMAPEIAHSGMAGPEADLYSLGCVLFELLTGQLVFNAPTPQAMMQKHIETVPRSVHQLRADVPNWLGDLTAQLLAKLPAHRPAQALDVIDILEPHLPVYGSGADRLCGSPDPTRPFREPFRPIEQQVDPPLQVRRARRRQTPMRRTDLVDALAEANALTSAGDLPGARQVIDQCLRWASGQLGSLDPQVLSLRLSRAHLLLVMDAAADALISYQELRPDLVQRFGPHSSEVQAADDGIAACLDVEDGS
ncbi:serine/threonine-protein kinase [Kribbella solani]|uniref:non-specific serine/threonine protein kinase n=1 Tax=Kribbella solani TaxID=236067 RepID=A0A841DMF0_9ACTN|nr:serine/threonine-protein kinase [Kribbella solani]MBB5979843.1 serine/threonine protein kinase [Kribbella solani]